MPYNSVRNPWQIGGSDSEDDSSDDSNKRLPSVRMPSTSLASGRIQPPRLLDWGPVSIESDHIESRKRKTNPGSAHAPTFRGPVFVGQQNGKHVSPTLVSKHEIAEQNATPEVILQNSVSSSQCIDSSGFNPDTMISEDLRRFIYMPVPREHNQFIHCLLQRDKKGFQKSFHPTFYLYVQRPEGGKKTYLLVARKNGRLNGQAEYTISDAIETLSQKSCGEGFVGRLEEHGTDGTEYTLYDNGLSAHKFKKKHDDSTETLRRELLSVMYKSNLLGFHGPRQINVIIPKIGHDIQPKKGDKTMHDLWNDRRFTNLIQLRNRTPEKLENKKKFKLHFFGDYEIESSIKNFQIVMENENNEEEEEVVMQFGRIDDDKFICDYRYPLSAIQAFAIALSSFESRIRRD